MDSYELATLSSTLQKAACTVCILLTNICLLYFNEIELKYIFDAYPRVFRVTFNSINRQSDVSVMSREVTLFGFLCCSVAVTYSTLISVSNRILSFMRDNSFSSVVISLPDHFLRPDAHC